HVDDRQRIEDDLAEEIRIELGGAIRETDDRGEAAEEQDDPGEDEPRVVAERAPLGGRRRRGPPRRQLRSRRRVPGGGHPFAQVLLRCSSSISRLNSPTSRNWR